MAYISTERVAEIRKELKVTFPTFKFSARTRNYSTVDITILSAPINLMEGIEGTHHSVNVYWINDNFKSQPETCSILKKIMSIANVGNFDNSDIMTDYVHVGFYVDISIGDWEKPFTVTPNN